MKARLRRMVRPLLEFQARRLISGKKLKVVAVAGAVGKTSTKLAIATVLSSKFKVLAHPGSFNVDVSLPLAIFELEVPDPIINPLSWIWRLIQMEIAIHRPYPYNLVVLELGTDTPGEIPHFMTYLQPDLAVVTAVALEHMEHFDDLSAVAKEELSIVNGSKMVLINNDDVAAEYRHKYVDKHPKRYSYGLGSGLDYSFSLRSTDLLHGTTGSFRKSDHPGTDEMTIGVVGRHSAKALAAAFGAGDLMGLTPTQLETGLAKITPVAGRMNPLLGINGSVIIDDSYNSSPEAALAAISALTALPVTGRRIAIMGSMNELGSSSPDYHARVGAACAGLDLLITVGDLAKDHLGPAAVAGGLDPTRFRPADSPYAAGNFLKLLLQPGDVVLGKGSQNGVFVEEALKPLLRDPTDAKLLVRQSPYWLRTKSSQFLSE